MCRDSTLVNEDVADDIAMARDLGTELGDSKFVIPLRLEQYKKVHGLGDTVNVDFVRGWAEGLTGLLETLRRQKVPRGDLSRSELSYVRMMPRLCPGLTAVLRIRLETC